MFLNALTLLNFLTFFFVLTWNEFFFLCHSTGLSWFNSRFENRYIFSIAKGWYSYDRLDRLCRLCRFKKFACDRGDHMRTSQRRLRRSGRSRSLRSPVFYPGDRSQTVADCGDRERLYENHCHRGRRSRRSKLSHGASVLPRATFSFGLPFASSP